MLLLHGERTREGEVGDASCNGCWIPTDWKRDSIYSVGVHGLHNFHCRGLEINLNMFATIVSVIRMKDPANESCLYRLDTVLVGISSVIV